MSSIYIVQWLYHVSVNTESEKPYIIISKLIRKDSDGKFYNLNPETVNSIYYDEKFNYESKPMFEGFVEKLFIEKIFMEENGTVILSETNAAAILIHFGDFNYVIIDVCIRKFKTQHKIISFKESEVEISHYAIDESDTCYLFSDMKYITNITKKLEEYNCRDPYMLLAKHKYLSDSKTYHLIDSSDFSFDFENDSFEIPEYVPQADHIHNVCAAFHVTTTKLDNKTQVVIRHLIPKKPWKDVKKYDELVSFDEDLNYTLKPIFTYMADEVILCDEQPLLLHLGNLEYIFIDNQISKFTAKSKITSLEMSHYSQYTTNYALDEDGNCYLINYNYLIPNIAEKMIQYNCDNPYFLLYDYLDSRIEMGKQVIYNSFFMSY